MSPILIDVSVPADSTSCLDSLSVKEKRVILTKKVESLAKRKFDPRCPVIGEYLSQIDSQFRVNLTQIFSNYLASRVEF